MPPSTPQARFPTPIIIALLIIPVNIFVWFESATHRQAGPIVFTILAAVQLILSIIGIVLAIRRRKTVRSDVTVSAIITGSLTGLGAIVGWGLGMLVMALSMGAAWGRPLRVRGRQVHAVLEPGSGWASGDQPTVDDLDPTTAQALEALWLHDAQKEHASVPAFARLTWLLTAAGAPADLLAWSQRAGLEEIDHAQRCFALATGYGSGPRQPMPMPELLAANAFAGSPRAVVTLAVESVTDGCLLEDFNADVAAACATVCTIAAPRAVLEQIAREERSHAAFSWTVLRWTLSEHRDVVLPAVRQAIQDLHRLPRPTAANDTVAPLVANADATALQRHGRLPDSRWQELWDRRRQLTQERMERLLARTVTGNRPSAPELTTVG